MYLGLDVGCTCERTVLIGACPWPARGYPFADTVISCPTGLYSRSKACCPNQAQNALQTRTCTPIPSPRTPDTTHPRSSTTIKASHVRLSMRDWRPYVDEVVAAVPHGTRPPVTARPDLPRTDPCTWEYTPDATMLAGFIGPHPQGDGDEWKDTGANLQSKPAPPP
jgi:hypothetical protein